MAKRVATVLFGLSLTTWIVGCGEPPTDRAEAVNERLAALADEAATYAPDAYRAAQEAAAQLDAEIEAQAGRFAPVRSYDRAGELAAAAETAASDVERAIEAEKKRLQSEADRLVAEGRDTLTEARQRIEDGLAAREIAASQAETWRAELAAAEASLEEAAALRDAGQLAEASRDAESALQTATQVGSSVAAVQAELEEARAEAAARAARGDVTLPRTVLADGKPLAAGTYRLQLADEGPADEPARRWVEFVRNGAVAGRTLAVVIADAEIGEVAKSPPPRNEARLDWLVGGEYVRVWLNRDGMNYLIHLPLS